MSLLLSRLAARTPLVRRAAVAQLAAAAAPLRAVSLAQLHSVSFVAAAAPAAPSATAAAAASSVNPVKLTTNITGLDAIPNAREVLMGLLKETLASIESYNAALGFEPAYNLGVRQLSQHRLKICEQNESHEAIEKAIWFGQIEELIQQAEDELDLLVTMNEEVKPWVEDPAMKAEVTSMMSPNFGETREEMERQTRGEYIQQTPEEKAAEEAFWAPIDAEIKEEQQREAEARAQRS